ncbi:renalase-like [Periplaneta americana]|uniref:renalase-like n=1 Tax=Periplaneta americana TaxID=6978 RepID=UPI0037E96573
MYITFAVVTDMVCKILLVGTGLTSAVTGFILRKTFSKGIYLVAWDKAKTAGGRLITDASPTDPNCIADLGAQYITSSQDNFTEHSVVYESLIGAKLLEPLCSKIDGMRDLPPDTKQFVATRGMSALVKHFLFDVADEIHFEHEVIALNVEDRSWLVETKSGVRGTFDIVILTIPIPQVLQLIGFIQEVISKNEKIEHNLKAVDFTSRYALCLFFNYSVEFSTGWDSKYIYDDEIFRYISIENQKRNEQNCPSAVVFHTSVHYGAKNCNRNLRDVEHELTCRAKNLFPDWPTPAYVMCKKWEYSQVKTPYSGQPGCIILEEQPLLIAGGDSFTSSHFDGCIISAVTLTNKVIPTVMQYT